MPKQSYGAIPKGRSQSLLFALLDFANDSLDGDETKIDRLRSPLQIQWQTSNRLIVRTKLRYLQTLNNLANPENSLTLPQIKTALKHFADRLGILEDHRTMTRGSDDWHFTLNFWGDRWDRDGNLASFEQAWAGHHGDILPKVTLEKSVNQGDRWQDICRETLNTRLTSTRWRK